MKFLMSLIVISFGLSSAALATNSDTQIADLAKRVKKLEQAVFTDHTVLNLKRFLNERGINLRLASDIAKFEWLKPKIAETIQLCLVAAEKEYGSSEKLNTEEVRVYTTGGKTPHVSYSKGQKVLTFFLTDDGMTGPSDIPSKQNCFDTIVLDAVTNK